MTYLLHTIGELFLSPVGLSAMTKLAPTRVVSLMMGAWFLAASIGNYMAGFLLRFYESFSVPTLFGVVATFTFGAALVMALLVRPIKKMLSRSASPAARAAAH
jgi:POT family proton-dependent oligopeptide transporter